MEKGICKSSGNYSGDSSRENAVGGNDQVQYVE